MKPSLNTAPTEIIYTKANIKILVGPTATPEIVNLLKRTVYGTHGPRYQHTGQEEKLAMSKILFSFSY